MDCLVLPRHYLLVMRGLWYLDLEVVWGEDVMYSAYTCLHNMISPVVLSCMYMNILFSII